MEKKKTPSTFDKLYAINVNDKTDKKGPKALTYLAWSSAWSIIKETYPEASYTEYECVDSETNLVLNYFHDNKSCWVKVGTRLTKDGQEYIKTLPIMDYHYKSISVEKVTSQDVNTALQRCLVKSLAMHGLGLYIYEKDELPVSQAAAPVVKKEPVAKTLAKKKPLAALKIGDENWGKFVLFAKAQKGKLSIEQIYEKAASKYKVGVAVKKELTKILS